MYKLFLCLHYLRSRVIAYFAVLGVMLCVAMMLISVSVMNGFLRTIEVAARGLFGEILIESGGQHGIAEYDAFIERLKKEVPEVQAASPFIISYGFLRVPESAGYRKAVQVAGIRLPERADVTDFEKGLFIQAGLEKPTFDPPVSLVLDGLDEGVRRIDRIRQDAETADRPAEATSSLLDDLDQARITAKAAAGRIRNRRRFAEDLRKLQAQLDTAQKAADEDRIDAVEARIRRARELTYEPPANRIILGLGISGLSFRTGRGEVVRRLTPGRKVILDVFPLGRDFSLTDFEPARRMLTVIDDCKTGVSSIDSEIVYLPFKTLQTMNNMDSPARCSAIHVKVRSDNGGMSEPWLRHVADKVRACWERFRGEHPEAALVAPDVRTWRQRNHALIRSIESQRTLVVIMFGIISLVSVVLIFVIFYMIVFQKTREIGILKAVGASGWGIEAIFLTYGAIVGLLGAALGIAIGAVFVHNINPIHDWVGATFGLVVWDREVFMFDAIPNTVQWADATMIVVWSVASGLVGALVPATRAARMQPVEALRYE